MCGRNGHVDGKPPHLRSALQNGPAFFELWRRNVFQPQTAEGPEVGPIKDRALECIIPTKLYHPCTNFEVDNHGQPPVCRAMVFPGVRTSICMIVAGRVISVQLFQFQYNHHDCRCHHHHHHHCHHHALLRMCECVGGPGQAHATSPVCSARGRVSRRGAWRIIAEGDQAWQLLMKCVERCVLSCFLCGFCWGSLFGKEQFGRLARVI